MKQTYITSVSSDNLSNENICGWIISPLLMQKWGEALHFSLADLTSYRLFDRPTERPTVACKKTWILQQPRLANTDKGQLLIYF